MLRSFNLKLCKHDRVPILKGNNLGIISCAGEKFFLTTPTPLTKEVSNNENKHIVYEKKY